LKAVPKQVGKLIALVESPVAMRNLHEIAALKSVDALMFGSEDYAAEMGVSPNAKAIEHAVALVAIAATAAGKPAYGVAGSLSNFSDLEKFKRDIELTYSLGFSGALAIHPNQLPIIKAAFAPQTSEIEWAQKIIATHNDNPASAFSLDGRMIDAPVIQQAQRILKRANDV
jgi:citrate lyase subunit beta / citryl-CoA lyase